MPQHVDASFKVVPHLYDADSASGHLLSRYQDLPTQHNINLANCIYISQRFKFLALKWSIKGTEVDVVVVVV